MVDHDMGACATPPATDPPPPTISPRGLRGWPRRQPGMDLETTWVDGLCDCGPAARAAEARAGSGAGGDGPAAANRRPTRPG
eukprot:9000969-Pyramimonas_sp.AAC.1